MNKNSSPADEFADALQEHAPRFNIQLNARASGLLREYYELVLAWNARLHLVAPCSPEEFATRHILESLLAVEYMVAGAHVLDVGSGAGLPVIPCLIVRTDLRATLFESSKKKSIFLREALRCVGAQERAKVIAERFEKIDAPPADYVTCRALERFTEIFQQLLAWSPKKSTLLFFGGETLRAEIEKASLTYKSVSIPEAERRFLFIIGQSKN
jgi:16S rRNA (guanine527-N7)-methyltransferase